MDGRRKGPVPGRVKVKKRLGWKIEPEKRKLNPQSRIGWGGGRNKIPPHCFRKLHILQGYLGQNRALLTPDSMPGTVYRKYINR